MKSEARSVADYIAALPPERRTVVKQLRQAIRKTLPRGFREMMGYAMMAYVVPLKAYPAGYLRDPKRPLPFINLASQKQYISLYHMGLYDGPLLKWLRTQWPRHTDAKLDVGKCCVRLKKLDQVPYDLIGELAGKMTPEEWIDIYERSRAGR